MKHNNKIKSVLGAQKKGKFIVTACDMVQIEMSCQKKNKKGVSGVRDCCVFLHVHPFFVDLEKDNVWGLEPS